MAQWNMHQQAVIPQSLLEQKPRLQIAPAPSPHKRGALLHIPHQEQNQPRGEKSQLKPQNRSLEMKHHLLEPSVKEVAKTSQRALTSYLQLQDHLLSLSDRADEVFSTVLHT